MIEVDWMLQYGNSPTITLRLDHEIPDVFHFNQIGERTWVAETDGFISYFAHDGSANNNGGYGGAVRTVTMSDGSIREFIGPWSSRIGVVNHYKGFAYGVDVTIITPTKHHYKAVTVEYLKWSWEMYQTPYYLVGTNGPRQDDYPPTISMAHNCVQKPNGKIVRENCETLIERY